MRKTWILWLFAVAVAVLLGWQYYGSRVNSVEPVTVDSSSQTPDEEIPDVVNPDKPIVLVNREQTLPKGFVPKRLVVPRVAFAFDGDHPKKQMRPEAARALEALFAQASRDGVSLVAVSGYRSEQRQAEVYAGHVRRLGEQAANEVSARPGQSEHQTGWAMDVSSFSVGYQLVEEFGDTMEGRWLAENAADYGFVIRYPKGKEDITGYRYEPWHLRYLGVHALAVAREGLTLEEYLYRG